MKIINLRTVGSFEIPDSFRGILRISPNDGIDDPSTLITTVGTEIILSDSIGTELPIKFKVKSFNVKLVERDNIDMINLAHNYLNLYITKSLHIRPTLYINKNNDPINNRPPLIFIKDGNAVGYPIEAPDDIRYANWNNRLGTSAFETLSPTNELFNENGKYRSEHIIIDGATQYQYITHFDNNDNQYKYYKVPEINRRIYALGSCPGHTYKVSDFNIGSHDLSGITSNIPTGRYTQLSFLNLDNVIWSNVEANATGSYRSEKGRYFNLEPVGPRTENNNTENKLYEELFGESFNEALKLSTIMKNSPIVGTPVPSGSIHYNAIPPRNYFFHLARHSENLDKVKKINDSKGLTYANLTAGGTMNNLLTEYVLCDGKEIYNETTSGATTDYPNVNTKSFKTNWSSIHDKMSIKTSSGKKLVSPALFELDQLSMRYLRGLNWLRRYEENSTIGMTTYRIYPKNTIFEKTGSDNPNSNHKLSFVSNGFPYLITEDTNKSDLANHIKDISVVGNYYANYDTLAFKRYKHAHLLFTSKKSELTKSDETDSSVLSTIAKGKNDAYNPTGWYDYITNTSNSATFQGTKMMRTVGNILHGKADGHLGSSYSIKLNNLSEADSIRILQDWPISVDGGSNKYFHSVLSCIRYGKKRLGKCMNSRTRCGTTIRIRDSRYTFASSKSDTSWRFLTSLPIQNKFGKKTGTSLSLSKANYNGTNIKLDDTLPAPPSINFIPLIKL